MEHEVIHLRLSDPKFPSQAFLAELVFILRVRLLSPTQGSSSHASDDDDNEREQRSLRGGSRAENLLLRRSSLYTFRMPEVTVQEDTIQQVGPYEDDALYKLIAQAERNAEMENHASYLQVEQTRYWIDKKNNPSEIFHLFQLDKMQSRKDIFSNPEFTAWVKYVDDLNTKYPDQPVSMTPTLAKYFAEGGLLQLM
ncbi:hypothetical protein PC128_g13972 [Phytophthora cactorum]|nr:hypothetical protein PC128_g13972 [Phytophthora cactorum]